MVDNLSKHDYDACYKVLDDLKISYNKLKYDNYFRLLRDKKRNDIKN
ncbi:MAG: hypothetical protein ACD_58C00304G0014 [uncultured bacterium]|nr:MAG: hypothetical protein ACD_58C00304G0014 [uncultured bacterium]